MKGQTGLSSPHTQEHGAIDELTMDAAFLIFTKKGRLPVLIYTVLFTCFLPDFPTPHALSHFSMSVVLFSFNLCKLKYVKQLV